MTTHGIFRRPIPLVGAALVPLYWGIYGTRRALYATGALRTHKSPVPVLSVGNLSAGGTGKTPVVEYIARLMPAAGKWPGIVSRGYGRTERLSEVVLVSDGSQLLASVAEGGDEPVLLAKSLPGIAVAVASERYRACEYLVERSLCDCVLLDDGFQHWSLARDADIVLVDATEELSQMRLMPAGFLREPASALRRAFAIIHTKVGNPEAVAQKRDFYRANRARVSAAAPGVPQFAARFIPDKLLRLSRKGPDLDFLDLPGMKVCAFAGVHNPDNFFGTLRSLGCDVVGKPFVDHADYEYADVARLLDFAVDEECEAVITTAKDAVKLENFELPADPPIYVLTQTVELDDPDGFQDTLRWAVSGDD